MRFVIAALAVIGIVALATGEAVQLGGFVSTALTVLVVLALVKMIFMGAAFGMYGRKAMRGRTFGSPCFGGRRPEWRQHASRDDARDTHAGFDEWHRMAHARREVDSWVGAEEGAEGGQTPE